MKLDIFLVFCLWWQVRLFPPGRDKYIKTKCFCIEYKAKKWSWNILPGEGKYTHNQFDWSSIYNNLIHLFSTGLTSECCIENKTIGRLRSLTRRPWFLDSSFLSKSYQSLFAGTSITWPLVLSWPFEPSFVAVWCDNVFSTAKSRTVSRPFFWTIYNWFQTLKTRSKRYKEMEYTIFQLQDAYLKQTSNLIVYSERARTSPVTYQQNEWERGGASTDAKTSTASSVYTR